MVILSSSVYKLNNHSKSQTRVTVRYDAYAKRAD